MKEKKAIIFDLDGTLIDSIKDVHVTLNATLADMQYPILSNSDIHTLIGPDLRVSLPKHLKDPEFNFDDFQHRFSTYYSQRDTDTTQLFPYVKKTLQTLHANGKHCFVLTNKPEPQSRKILDKLGVLELIQTITGPDTYNIAKPNPIGIYKIQEKHNLKTTDMVMVGDTEIDIQTANAANIHSVGVLYGYRSEDALKKENPTQLIKRIDELLDLRLN